MFALGGGGGFHTLWCSEATPNMLTVGSYNDVPIKIWASHMQNMCFSPLNYLPSWVLYFYFYVMMLAETIQ